ncbi:hypothetical protein [Pseudoalteromonas sp. APC 3694]|uniref:hypothetical protein n=1 Tax=Pseudoalteromonas sp. APC 3694 TaxID=3035202 RepID=UPI0025B4EDC8|nr:hypothetical protein [Pseudoalteromonas sp. APC 3694]MDN3489504.1 hypothetical protein [Pseudoalteromonas sp. APC 3694]
MELKELLEIAGVTLGALGGGAAIIFGFSSWLGKIWAYRLMEKEKAEHYRELESLRNKLTQDTESYKVKLKKSEFIFEKEYEAASELVSLKRSFLPTYSHPNMCWNEACDEVAHNFHKIETALSSYLSKHGAVLSKETKDLLSYSIGIAGESKFDITNPDVPTEASAAADKLLKKLDEAEECLLNQVHSQSSS